VLQFQILLNRNGTFATTRRVPWTLSTPNIHCVDTWMPVGCDK